LEHFKYFRSLSKHTRINVALIFALCLTFSLKFAFDHLGYDILYYIFYYVSKTVLILTVARFINNSLVRSEYEIRKLKKDD